MSYVAKKSHIFDTSDSVGLLKARPAGRLKTHNSSTDLRSWSNSEEDHRQYILELINRDYLEPTYWGTYVPIPDLLKILMKQEIVQIDNLENYFNNTEKISEIVVSPKKSPYTKKPDKKRIGGNLVERDSRRSSSSDDECNLLLLRAVKQLENIKAIVVKEPNNKDAENLERESDIELLKQQNGRYRSSSDSSSKILLETRESRDTSDNDLKSLRQRLINLKNLPILVKALKNKLESYEKQNRYVQNQSNDPLIITKRSIDYEQENQNLLEKCKKLEKEIENSNCKAKQSECMRIELDCLKDRLSDFCRLQRDYDDLKRRTYDYDDVKADLLYFKEKYEKLKRLPDQIQSMQARLKHIDMLEQERESLSEELGCYQCCVANQKEEIQQLRCYIASLEDQLNKKEEETQTEVSSMRQEMEKKDELLSQSQLQLQKYQDELRSTIKKLNCEVYTLRNQLEKCENKLRRKKEEISCLREKLEKFEEMKTTLEEQVQKPAGDQHYQSIMKQTQQILKCLIQRLRQEEE